MDVTDAWLHSFSKNITHPCTLSYNNDEHLARYVRDMYHAKSFTFHETYNNARSGCFKRFHDVDSRRRPGTGGGEGRKRVKTIKKKNRVGLRANALPLRAYGNFIYELLYNIPGMLDSVGVYCLAPQPPRAASPPTIFFPKRLVFTLETC